MKSIANQYRDLQEGKMSQANFMRNLRMNMPQITNTTSFGDAVKILKNKGIITEVTFSGSGTPDEDRPMRAAMPNMDRVAKRAEDPEYDFDKEEPNEDTEFDAILKQLEDEMGGEDAVKGQYDVNEVELTAKQIVDKYNEMFGKSASTTFKDVAKALGVDEEKVAVALGLTGLGFNENVSENALNLTARQVMDKFEELLNKNPNAKVEDLAKTLNTTPYELAKIIGISDLYSAKPTMNETKEVVNPNKIHPQEYTMGIRYELKCFKGDVVKAERAVLKNLAKEPFYYTALKLAGKDIYKEKAAKPEVVAKKKKATKPELVDKANGMVKVKMPKTVKEAMEIDVTGNLNNKPDLNNTPDEQRLAKLLSQYPALIAALAKVKETGEWDGFFLTILNDTSIDKASKSALRAAFQKALDQTKGSIFTSDKVNKNAKVPGAIFNNPANARLNKGLNDIGGIKEADAPQDDKVEAELASALSQQPTLKRILQKVDLPQEVNGTVKALLDRTNLKNVPDAIILAALRKVLNDQPGPSFTAQYAANKNIGKPLPDLKEKLISMVREILAEEEAPSKKKAASEITAKAVEYIDDYNEGEKTYKKSQLENVFDSYEDKVGRHFDDSVFEDVIDMLKAKGYTMDMKETFDGRDNLDA